MSFESLLLLTGRLEQGAEVETVSGERDIAWTFIATIKCMVNPVPQFETVKQGVSETFTHIVYTLYRDDITAAPKDPWRVLIGVEEYRVVTPYDPAQRHNHLELRCRKLE